MNQAQYQAEFDAAAREAEKKHRRQRLDEMKLERETLPEGTARKRLDILIALTQDDIDRD